MAFLSISIPNLYFIDDLYQKFLEDPSQVASSWHSFFQGMHLGLSQSRVGLDKEKTVRCLIDAYRKYGYLLAHFNPLGSPPNAIYELDAKTLGIDKDLNTLFPTCGLLQEKEAPLQKILDLLKETYCSKIGIEYMDLRNPKLEKWIQSKVEPYFLPQLDKQQKLLILQDLQRAELFESFLQTKYVGQKRFSLEGAETLIPMLGFLIEQAASNNADEIVLGMAHRGRLNVLANIVHKDYASIFKEFDENYYEESTISGDVKYHQGAQGIFITSSGKDIPVTLVANPSHLESVDPVVEGMTYAKLSTKNVIPVLIHGDASFSGQGVVYETLQLCKLKGYQTKGTVHIIINNQIGFTTNPEEGRSTPYCSDLAKTFNCPVFHVNAEDPEGCVWATILSLKIRDTFGCDVFIDLNCYRKYGHNESDEPLFSQPALYAKITKKKSIRTLFSEKMLQENSIQESDIKSFEEAFKKKLQEALAQPSYTTVLKKTQESLALSEIDTKVSLEVLQKIGKPLCMYPDNFHLNPKITRLLQEREKMLKSEPTVATLDWAIAEQLSFASLLFQNIGLRFSGQDVCRGTFSHRHAVFIDQLNEQNRYFPLSHIAESQAECAFFNSPLSEYAVLGFEFGFSLSALSSLVIWEAQFGDFANGAQIILDQYLAPSEQKWGVISNLVLMLPHGYEGQGPEHSSARIERFLQLAAQDNLRIANCSTPAQLFHLMRAQAISPVKKPLILFTPKALLRNPECKSSLNDLAEGHFHEVLEDPLIERNATLLLFCSGKVYYDLVAERKKQNKQCAIIRLEQLYPFPQEAIKKVLAKHPNAHCRFIQEEPSNMGAWESLRYTFDELLGTKSAIEYIGRQRSASPATGSYAVHKQQLEDLLKKAFAKT